MNLFRATMLITPLLFIMTGSYAVEELMLEKMTLEMKRSDVNRVFESCAEKHTVSDDYDGMLSIRSCGANDEQGVSVMLNIEIDSVIFIGTWESIGSSADLEAIKKNSVERFGVPTEHFEGNGLWQNCYGDCELDQYGESLTISSTGKGLIVQLAGLGGDVQLSYRLLDKVAIEALKVRE